MSRSKKIIMIIVIIITVIAVLSLIALNIVKNKRIMDNEINSINLAYEKLSNSVNSYNEIRTKYNELSKEIILDSYKDKYEEYNDLLTKYNSVIMDIDKYIDLIDKKCYRLYDDSNVNNICNNYKNTYEKLINLYISDILSYNNNLKKYNDYKNDNLSMFNLIHSEYIDYNNDGVYDGRYGSNEEKEA